MMALTFELHLKEPLLATGLEGDPNSAVSLPFIPGSMLRGLMIGLYLAGNPSQNLAADPQARALFFDGQTRYLNAYPLGPKGRRMLPTPRSWRRKKYAQRPIYDLSVEPEPDEVDLAQLQVVKDQPFCWLDDEGVVFAKPDKQVHIHTQRDRVMGRAIKGSGAVFRYEALAPGQAFVAVILCDENAAAEFESLLDVKTVLLGGSQSAGYGLVELHKLRRAPQWAEVSRQAKDVPAGGQFCLTLLSDALLRDDYGQHTASLTPEMLGARLGVELNLEATHTHAQHSIVGGFNRKWGLPLPQTPVARAGSVCVFQTQAPIPAARLNELLERGIGERRAEGLGRLACNWHAVHECLEPEPFQVVKVDEDMTLTDESAVLARRMAERMLRRKLDGQLRERVNSLRLAAGPISNSQLSAVRVLVRSALPSQKTKPIQDHLKDLKQTAGDQFDEARLGKQSLRAWLQDVLAEPPEMVWERLFNSGFDPAKLPRVGGEAAEWQEPLAREYALRLVDGVLGRAIESRRSEK